MEPEFWHERWDRDQIGFHQHEVNPYLRRHFHRLEAPRGAEVLVPLCGKSLDLLWLSDQAYRVTGVEINRKAVTAFFSENALEPVQRDEDGFTVFDGGSITVYCGDFFGFRNAVERRWQYCYDRAALIALPPPMRREYAREMRDLLGPGARSLLITLEYEQAEMNGPPFSVMEDEVRSHFESGFTVRRLTADDVLERNPHFRDRGLTALLECSYLLSRRTSVEP